MLKNIIIIIHQIRIIILLSGAYFGLLSVGLKKAGMIIFTV